MKLKNYFLLSLLIGASFSCSSDNEPVNAIKQPDAMLALAINVDQTMSTKAGDQATNLVSLDARIKALHVFVFNADGTFMAGKDSVLPNADLSEQAGVSGENKYKTANQVLSIPVISGNAKVIVIANGSINASGYGKSLTELCANTTSLDSEVSGSYTMSSRVIPVSIYAGKLNCVGYSDSECTTKQGTNIFQESSSSPAVLLYRSVAKIKLGTLTLKETTNNNIGTPVKFKVDTVYVANVKSLSQLANISESTGWGAALEVATLQNAEWWYGAITDQTGEYKSIVGGTLKSNLLYVPTSNLEISKGASQTMNNAFAAYENTTSVGSQTLLIVRGDYSYIPSGGTVKDVITIKDRYYTVPVNNMGQLSYTGVTEHSGIKRNVQYNVNLTIASEGSTLPYDKDASACIEVAIQVENWNVVNMNENLQ